SSVPSRLTLELTNETGVELVKLLRVTVAPETEKVPELEKFEIVELPAVIENDPELVMFEIVAPDVPLNARLPASRLIVPAVSNCWKSTVARAESIVKLWSVIGALA